MTQKNITCEIVRPLAVLSENGRGYTREINLVSWNGGEPKYDISSMTSAGINVITRNEVLEHFAVIDDDIVWHGGVNLLGHDDIWDNLTKASFHKSFIDILLEVAIITIQGLVERPGSNLIGGQTVRLFFREKACQNSVFL